MEFTQGDRSAGASPPERESLDRLVDGEMPDEERRNLLISLDSAPNGWRKCALAFLEAQSLRQDLSFLAKTPELNGETLSIPPNSSEVAISSAMSKSPAPRAARPASSIPWTPLAVAASFGIAFALGLGAKGFFSNSGDRRADSSAPRVQEASAGNRAEPRTNSPDPHFSGTPPNGRPSRYARVRYPAAEGGDWIEEVHVPLADAERLDERLFRADPAEIPRDVRDSLERLGYQVESKRRLIPSSTGDGRSVVVPVDSIDIVPVSNRPY